MLIDWFTVVAQAINFLILVWLLQRFLYKPVLTAIETRAKKVAAQLADATQKEAQARLEREEFQNRKDALEREREELLRKAGDAAAAERQRLLEAARQESQLLRARLSDELGKERQELGRRLVARTQAEVFALTRQTLADLASISVEARMVEVFVARLHDLPETQRRLLSGSGSAVVRSAFELTSTQRADTEHAIAQCLGSEVIVRFECLPGLICGVELTVNGIKLAWSVADHLTQAAQEVLDLNAAVPAAAGEPIPVPTLEIRRG
jgi:F-type H+-transporting ATPase subunit b